MRPNVSRALLLLLLLTVAAFPLQARGRGKSVNTAPGKYTDWADEIDELEVVQSFKVADYKKVVVVPFDTEDTPLPNKDDNTYEPVKDVLANAAGPFAASLRENWKAASMPIEEAAKGSNDTLVVRVKVVEMDPGSRAARYWGGFGA